MKRFLTVVKENNLIFIIELRKIGTNINQMAKVINSGNTDIIDIQASWDNIEKELKGRFLNGG